jgi:hypothetical protein
MFITVHSQHLKYGSGTGNPSWNDTCKCDESLTSLLTREACNFLITQAITCLTYSTGGLSKHMCRFMYRLPVSEMLAVLLFSLYEIDDKFGPELGRESDDDSYLRTHTSF